MKKPRPSHRLQVEQRPETTTNPFAHSYRVGKFGLMCGILIQLLSPPVQSKTMTSLPNGVAAGDATATSVILWTRSTSSGKLIFRYWQAGKPKATGNTLQINSDGNTPVKIEAIKLLPGTHYHYCVTDSSGHSASGNFKTPHEDRGHHGLRFGVSGDARGDNQPYYAMRNLPKRQLNFVVNLGDTVYADVLSPALPGIPQAETLEQFRAKHAEIYSAKQSLNAMADARASTLFYSVIDDHEVSNDFAGGAPVSSDNRFTADDKDQLINTTTRYRNGMQAFMDFNPMRATYYPQIGDTLTDARPQFYRYQRFANDAALFITDARSFRNAALTAPKPGDAADLARFRMESFQEDRSLLGRRQLSQLLNDLDDAEAKGTTWKFVFIPEPIQNLSFIAAADRYEGYASERNALLKHIDTHNLHNVVFISADIHGTVVNNLTYQDTLGEPQIQTHSFEVTTGPWAYDAPLGPTAMQLLKEAQYLSAAQYALYQALAQPQQEDLLRRLLDLQLTTEGYDPVGLENSLIAATLERGSYTATHSYGWSEFAIDAKSQRLRVTTYGLNPNRINSGIRILSQFVVKPRPF